MEYLILGYLIGYLIFTHRQFSKLPESIGFLKVLTISLFYPIKIVNYLNIFLYYLGVHLECNLSIIASDKEMKEMTDKGEASFSDGYDNSEENEDEK